MPRTWRRSSIASGGIRRCRWWRAIVGSAIVRQMREAIAAGRSPEDAAVALVGQLVRD